MDKSYERRNQDDRENRTWELVDKPHDKDAINLKWVDKIKYNEDDSKQKYKAYLVIKGYSQQLGTIFNETFTPVVCGDNTNNTCNGTTSKVTSFLA